MTADDGRFVPYETLVRWGVVHERLSRLSDDVADLAESVGATIGLLSGRFDADGQFVGRAGLFEDALADDFWEQFHRDVCRRLPPRTEDA